MHIDFTEVRATAEKYYRDGDFYCSEAVVKTIKDAFGLGYDDTVIALASGFPVGIRSSGCICGAVTGGVMALGMVFGRTQPKDERVNKALVLSKELHDQFRSNHKSLCCRVLTKGLTLGTPEHKNQCVAFTGEVAEFVARLIVREQN